MQRDIPRPAGSLSAAIIDRWSRPQSKARDVPARGIPRARDAGDNLTGPGGLRAFWKIIGLP